MKTKWIFLVILTLLLSLVFSSPTQTAMAATDVATFTFTSSLNPSGLYQEVTFTLSAVGTNPTHPPFGYVSFYDNGALIPDCPRRELNYASNNPTPDIPAVCTTRLTALGVHTITAFFDSLWSDVYGDATLTLEQTVSVLYPLTISPETLPDGVYGTYYEQQLTAPCSEGVECGAIEWGRQGTLPGGMDFFSNTGRLEGMPQSVGVFNFTVTANDYAGSFGSRTYTWNVLKATPEVAIDLTSVSDGMIYLKAFVRHPNHYWEPQPAGAVSFSVDGVPVEGCSGEYASQVIVAWGLAECYTAAPADLQLGSHSVQADFTPDSSSAANYNSASGAGTFTVYARVDGLLFNDLDRDGVQDVDEGPLSIPWEVGLDQNCDDSNQFTTTSDNSTGQFSFETAIPGATYCLVVPISGNWRQSTVLQPFITDEEYTFDIGLYVVQLAFSPVTLPDASVGEAYSQAIAISGGTPPYAVTNVFSSLPEGMTFDSATLTLSGTPTAAGYGYLSLEVKDADGITGGWYSQFYVTTDGSFTLASEPNPSALGQEVTFTFTGSGDVVLPDYDPFPPIGQVAFFDGDTPIEGCSVYLNYVVDSNTIGDYPAKCTTAALTEGTHQITATFTSFGLYRDASLTLTQVVGQPDTTPLTIGPETLGAEYGRQYSQQLTASGGSVPYTFSLLSGTLPVGFSLSEDGLLSGLGAIYYGSVPGTYPITIQVQDGVGGIGSRDYSFVLDKGTPTMTPYASAIGVPGYPIYWMQPFTLWAEVWIDNSYVRGTANFFIDGNPVPGCQAVDLESQLALCRDITMGLSLGEHTFEIDYWPTGYENYYKPAVGSGTFTVEPGSYSIVGFLFKDNDQDGVFDYGSEVRLYDSWTVNLDQDCDEDVDYTTTTSSYGMYEFSSLPGGHCYRITEVLMPGWQQTTQLADFWLSNHISYGLEIGNYYPTITVSPYELPSGNVGVAYNQTFTASGGAEPYKYTIEYGALPAGLTLSADGILSGTPTAAGSFYIAIQIKDANYTVGYKSYSLNIRIDGVFTFTSSSNPSAPGDLVTFTVSATGDAVDPYYGPVPPVGIVTFFADGTPIEGCSVYLNYDVVSDVIGDYPATCTTSALTEGTHEISATFIDYLGIYNPATLTLTQNVQFVASADLSISKTDSKDPIKPGASLVYTLVVSNNGPDAAQTISLVDTLDRSTTYGSVSAPKGWKCKYTNYAVTCTSASLASGSSAIIKITVSVSKTAKVGKDLVNNASVSSTTHDPDLLNNIVVQKTLVSK